MAATFRSGPGIRELPSEERPRERLLREGPTALSAIELLAVILGSGSRGRGVVELAREVLVRAGGLTELRGFSAEELRAVPGLGPARAAAILAALELGRRGQRTAAAARPVLRSAADVAALLHTQLSLLPQEELWALLLDVKHRLMGVSHVYRGGLNAAFLRPAEVYREAVRRSAWAVIVVHNHPSGDPTPSADDLAATRWLEEAGEVLGVRLLDHIVIGREGYVSFREEGLLAPEDGPPGTGGGGAGARWAERPMGSALSLSGRLAR